MEEHNDLFRDVIQNELSRSEFLYSYREKQMIKKGEFKEVAVGQLQKIRYYSWIVLSFIMIFSSLGIYQFTEFTQTQSAFPLILAITIWTMVLFLTYLFTKEIISKKRTLEIILTLLES